MSRLHVVGASAILWMLGPIAFAQQPGKAEAAPDNPEFHFTVTTPLPLLYLAQPAVRDDLKLTKEQDQKIAAIQQLWTSAAKVVDLETGVSGSDNKTLIQANRKKLEAVLTVAQMKRLQQIILRHREKEHGLPAVLATVVGDLKLSAAQRERFDHLYAKRANAVLEYLTSEERANRIHRDVHQANTAFTEAVTALLTKEQQARLSDMLGEPFAADIKLGEPTSVLVTAARTILCTGSFETLLARRASEGFRGDPRLRVGLTKSHSSPRAV